LLQILRDDMAVLITKVEMLIMNSFEGSKRNLSLI